MKVKLIQGYNGNEPGTIITLDDKNAGGLIRRGLAVKAESSKPSDPGDMLKVPKNKRK
jgi:hypothetical protein